MVFDISFTWNLSHLLLSLKLQDTVESFDPYANEGSGDGTGYVYAFQKHYKIVHHLEPLFWVLKKGTIEQNKMPSTH